MGEVKQEDWLWCALQCCLLAGSVARTRYHHPGPAAFSRILTGAERQRIHCNASLRRKVDHFIYIDNILGLRANSVLVTHNIHNISEGPSFGDSNEFLHLTANLLPRCSENDSPVSGLCNSQDNIEKSGSSLLNMNSFLFGQPSRPETRRGMRELLVPPNFQINCHTVVSRNTATQCYYRKTGAKLFKPVYPKMVKSHKARTPPFTICWLLQS